MSLIETVPTSLSLHSGCANFESNSMISDGLRACKYVNCTNFCKTDSDPLLLGFVFCIVHTIKVSVLGRTLAMFASCAILFAREMNLDERLNPR